MTIISKSVFYATRVLRSLSPARSVYARMMCVMRLYAIIFALPNRFWFSFFTSALPYSFVPSYCCCLCRTKDEQQLFSQSTKRARERKKEKRKRESKKFLMRWLNDERATCRTQKVWIINVWLWFGKIAYDGIPFSFKMSSFSIFFRSGNKFPRTESHFVVKKKFSLVTQNLQHFFVFIPRKILRLCPAFYFVWDILTLTHEKYDSKTLWIRESKTGVEDERFFWCGEMSLHNMIQPQNPRAHSIHSILYFSYDIFLVFSPRLQSSSSWPICYYSSGVSACDSDLCDLITAYNKLHIHAIRQEFITNVDGYDFLSSAVATFFHCSERGDTARECGIIIRVAKSVDNLQRIVIQNGQPLLIKHCPKCRVRERKTEREREKIIIAHTQNHSAEIWCAVCGWR